jgi:hypothetical protein
MVLFANRLAFLSIGFIALASMVSAEDAAAKMQCGNRSNAEPIDVSSNFTSLLVGAVCEDNRCDFLVPKEIHWHIYPTPKGTVPRQSMQPEGLLTPQVRDGMLSYQLQDILENAGFTKGQKLQAGVSLYIPQDRLSSIAIAGVEQYVQIHADGKELTSIEKDEPLVIIGSAIDSSVVVTSPYWKVDVTENGVDNQIYINAAAGSSIDISGVDIDAFVRCPGGLSIRARGVDNDILVDGPVAFGSLEGVDADIKINDGGSDYPCMNVTNTGVGNQCDDGDDVYEPSNLSCLADTEVGYQCSYWRSLPVAAQVGFGLGFLLLVAAIIISSIFCCKCCCREKCNRKHAFNHSQDEHTAKKFDQGFHGEEDTHMTAPEAEIIEIKEDNTDLEAAKEGQLAHSF